MWDIRHSGIQTSFGTFLTTHKRTQTGCGTYFATYTRVVEHSSPTHPHTHTGCETKPIDIQEDAGGMVNILGHDRVDHCEKNCSQEHASKSE